MASITAGNAIVCPFTIIVDTREQAPYTFGAVPAGGGRQWVVPIQCAGLRSGDYSIAGLESRIAIERKSLEDLYSTLGQGRERFESEFQRLAEMEFAAVCIEADIREIWRPLEFRNEWRSRLNPRSVEGTIVSWSIRYPRVHWWTMGSRRQAEIRVFATLKRFWDEQHNQPGR